MSITTERKQAMTMKNPPHPGLVVLQECIEPLGLTITRAAEALGVTRNTLSELANGKRGISPEMAVRLSKVFGGTEEGWLVQQAQYDLAQVRRDRLKLRRLEVAWPMKPSSTARSSGKNRIRQEPPRASVGSSTGRSAVRSRRLRTLTM